MMLNEIVEYKIKEVMQKQSMTSIHILEQRIAKSRPVRDMKKALVNDTIGIIAEVKYRSPSKGILRADFDPLSLARTYQYGGADAISVLADSRFFGGAPYVVSMVANDVELTLPVLYKDFIVSEYQIFEARAMGADAVLLIVRILESEKLKFFLDLISDLGMSALVETFDQNDIDLAVKNSATIIGINNRDLNSFNVDFKKTEQLYKSIPNNVITVSESGISTRKELLEMEVLGFNASLIGETIIKAEQPDMMIRNLKGFKEEEYV